MTNREAALKSCKDRLEHLENAPSHHCGKRQRQRAIELEKVKIEALLHQIWEEKLWHDAKTDPPKTPGLYYGKKDDTNSMYACQYRDGMWVLDMYPQQKMDIVQWADYTAFVRQDEDTALRPVSRERVEKVWRGCEYCKKHKINLVRIEMDYNDSPGSPERLNPTRIPKFCPICGAPMTEEAVETIMKRMEEMRND